MSLAGAEPGLWSIHGGNRRLPEELLKHSKANLLRAMVTKITYMPENGKPRYSITTNKQNSKMYDIVIVTAPLHDPINSISFDGFENPIPSYYKTYHRTVATFVQGTLNYTKFGYASWRDLPGAIITANSSLYFNSIGQHRPVDFQASRWEDKQLAIVWKVFSQAPLTSAQMDDLFVSYDEVKVVDWVAAYPHYASDESNAINMQLHPQLYYTSAMEQAASAAEIMAIAGRNSALLAYNTWNNNHHQIDPVLKSSTPQKEEL